MDRYFSEAKHSLEAAIPPFDSPDFQQMENHIRMELQRKENDLLILVRKLKILVLGDWFTEAKKQQLLSVKETLLKNGIYAQTIDAYYDMEKAGGLSPIQILETCCTNHQLIVFLDGEGKGTLTEQNYLCETYVFHRKIIFLIEADKFDRLKSNPSNYIKDFPTIITYRPSELPDTVLIYARFRIYRLASIIQKQAARGTGMHSPQYTPWSERLGWRKR